MRVAVLLFALCFAADAAWAAKGGKSGAAPLGAAPASPPPSGAARGGGASARFIYLDPRRAPPLDPKREVNEQDCTKPIDLSAGNLRCK